jgi:tetratricopeptide (TPR) repeat protein
MDNSTPDMNELLVRYLDGELSGSEKEDLEQRLATDEALQEGLESLKITREAVRGYGLKQQVANAHEQMMEKFQAPVRRISSTRRIIRYSIAVAASVLLVFTGIEAYILFTLSPNKLFSENYHSYELSTTRSGNGAEPKATEKAYKDKKYNDVITLSENSQDIEETFLAAMSYLELKNIPGAIEKFKKVIAQNEAAGTGQFRDEAEYYLVLAYISNKDYDPALELMKKIRNDPGHLYYEKISGKLVRNVKMLRWR